MYRTEGGRLGQVLGGRIAEPERLPIEPFRRELRSRLAELGGTNPAAQLAGALGVSERQLYRWLNESRDWIAFRSVDWVACHLGRHIRDFYPAAMEIALNESAGPDCPRCGARMLAPAPACGLCLLDAENPQPEIEANNPHPQLELGRELGRAAA